MSKPAIRKRNRDQTLRGRRQITAAATPETPHPEVSMSMKQLETFMSRVQSNDNIRSEVQRCGEDNSCVVKVAARHGHKFSPANLSRWQKDHS